MSEFSVDVLVTTIFFASRTVVASACVRPTTLGTATFAELSASVDLFSVPAAGVCVAALPVLALGVLFEELLELLLGLDSDFSEEAEEYS